MGLLYGVAPIVLDIKGETPITLQSLVILFVSISFGWRVGLPAVLVYILSGSLGLPVFAGYKSGVTALMGPYGGFFFGFLAAATVCGYTSELSAFRKTLPAILNWFLGHALILLFGAIWLMRLFPDGWQQVITDVLPGAIIKSITGALIVQLIIRFFNKKNETAFVD